MFDLWEFVFLGSTGSGRYAFVEVMKFDFECNQNQVWGPLGPGDMSIFVKHVLLAEIARGYIHSWKQR